ncbi:UvrD-helicase domain-containing protein [Fusobacterium polymorphum]|uniref:UvrD-helicase domain-containing protein n=1 Tax=Fusobacterium nucleatum subsp. polymorphum TaxID=76857 RepID=UPI0030D1E7D0
MFVILSFIVFIFVIIFLFNSYQKQKKEAEELKKIEEEKENKRKERLDWFEKNIKEKYEQLKILINLMKNKYIKFYSLDFYLNDFKVVKYNRERDKLKEELNNFYKYKEFIQDYDAYQDKLTSIILLEKDVIKLNKKYVERELKENKDFFSNVDGKSLDEQQRKSIVIDEDNNLIIAGAGSGKTLTISGKVKYLVERKKIKPEEILLITFTKAASNEMTERIKDKLKINVEASTFHSLGNRISRNFEDDKYEVLTSPYKYINEKSIIKLLLENKETSEALIDYITYYTKDNITEIDDNFKSKSEYYDLVDRPVPLNETLNEILYNSLINFKALYFYENKKSEDFNLDYCMNLLRRTEMNEKIRLKFKSLWLDNLEITEFEEKIIKEYLIDKTINLKNKKEIYDFLFHTTINGYKKVFKKITVKSEEERIIANFLYMNGIEFKYEPKYMNGNYKEPEDSYKTIRSYAPDFYLPEYDIYIEHFGVDENMKAHQYTNIENKKYEESMEWKRKIHKLNNTKLIETYSYYQQKGVLKEKLEEELLKNGVVFQPISNEEINLMIEVGTGKEEMSAFSKLVVTFLTLFKSNNYKEQDLIEFKNKAYSYSPFTRDKHLLFLKMFKPILEFYNKSLNKNKEIDFSDMINKATDHLNEKSKEEILELGLKYKYIIIDEFQDTSVARFKLVKAIRDKIEDCKILAVGDDWQSIYRFAGSDISIFTEFEKYFGKTEINFIEKTYRNSQELVNIAQNFVMSNPNQIKKNLKSDKKLEIPIIYQKTNIDNRNFIIYNIIKSISEEYGKKECSVTILARINANLEKLNSEYFKVDRKNDKLKISFKKKELKNINLDCKTVHTSKGLEADEIILIDVNDNIVGFPNKILDDSILFYVLSKSDSYLYGEERRLFYVALTRTRNRTFVLFDENYPSIFVRELFDNEEKTLDEYGEKRICKACGSHMIRRKNSITNEEFYGCYHYPKCDYTEPLEKINICPVCGGKLFKSIFEENTYYCNNYKRGNEKPHYKTVIKP